MKNAKVNAQSLRDILLYFVNTLSIGFGVLLIVCPVLLKFYLIGNSASVYLNKKRMSKKKKKEKRFIHVAEEITINETDTMFGQDSFSYVL